MMFQELSNRGFDIRYQAHANALLEVDFPEAVIDIEAILTNFHIQVAELVRGGGGEATITQRLRRALEQKGWEKKVFRVSKTIDDVQTESNSHEIDHVGQYQKGTIALELEWNNKDPFYDRDLENFKRLHADNAISLGIIITRGASIQASLYDLIQDYGRLNALASFDELDAHGIELTRRQRSKFEDTITRRKIPFHEAWAVNFVRDKFGQATTHWAKLEDRLARGVGNPCPFVGIGLPESIIIRG